MKFVSKGKGEVMQDAGLGRNLRRWVCGLMLLVPALLMPGQSAALTVVSQQDVGNVTVMEVSGSFNMLTPQSTYNSLARADAAKAFFTTHRDEYDFLVFFTNFDTQMPQGVGGFYLPVHRDIQGIGKEVEDYSTLFGSGGRLMATIDMGDVHDKILDPVDPDFEGTLQVLTHELMHHWGAYVKFRAPDGSISNTLLGIDGGHWSYLLDSNNSTLYGNHWRDNGDGTFTSIPPTTSQEGSSRGQLFSPLELYLMGINDQSQVPPLLLIKNPFIEAAQLPQLDDTITGEASWVTIDDIITAEGERVPAAADAQKNFRTAFIYLSAPGGTDPAQVADIESLRTEWIKRFSILTDGRSLMEVRSDLPIDDGLASNPGVTDPAFTSNPTPTVNSGVSWLVNHQQAGGSWQDLAGTATRDTAAAVTALANFSIANTSYQSGLTWLDSATPAGTDYLARQIESLQNKNAAVAALLAGQNSDGGWGSDAGYLSNPTDSGLALQALASAGQSGAAVQAAVNYLLETQNADGGWGVASGTSMIQPTAHALRALNAYRSSYVVASEISQAIAWLTSKQNGDGGFGNSPSTVYDTAAALVALRQSGAARSITDSGAAYLLTRQGTAGDWNGSAFQTALAIDALWIGQVQADLSILATDIAFNPISATAVPAPLTVTATVRNLGSADVNQAKVTLYAGDPSSSNLLDEKLVNVTGHGATAVVFSTTIANSGQHPLTVVIDPDRQLVEGDETNNQAVKTFLIEVPPPVIYFFLAAATVNEAIGTVNMQVNLDHPWDTAVTVAYNVAVSGTATTGTDFVLANGTLTFAPEETSKNIALTVVNDALAENDETVMVDLSTPVGGTLGVVTRQVVTILDNEVPIVTITSPAVGTSGDNTPLLSFSVSRGVPVVKVDGLVVSKVSGNELDPLTDGPHTVRVEAANGVGGVGYGEVSFTVDTKVPTVVITSPTSGYVFENNPLLIFTVDTAATITIKVDGIVVNKVFGDRLDPLSEGPQHRVRVEAVDSLGRHGTSEVVFVVNTQAPTITLVSPPEGISQYVNPVLSYNASVGGTVVVKVDGQIVSTALGAPLSILADGEHSVAVELTDGLGRMVRDENSFIVATGVEPNFSSTYSTTLGYTGSYSETDITKDKYGNMYYTSFASNGSNYDFRVVKLDQKGKIVFDKIYESPTTYETVSGIAVDSNENIYISVHSSNGSSFAGYQTDGTKKTYLIKFDKNFIFDWAKQIHYRNGYEYSIGVVVDSKDNVYIAGTTDGLSYNYSDHIYLISYKTDGTFIKEDLYGTGGLVYNEKIIINSFDNIYVSGDCKGTDNDQDIFVFKYNNSGTMVSNNWYGTSGNETFTDFGVDALGYFWVIGKTRGSFPGFVHSASIDDYFLIKSDDSGETKIVYQTNKIIDSIAVEQNGNIYVSYDYYIRKYDNNYNQIWQGTTSARIISPGNNGKIYSIIGSNMTAVCYKDTRSPTATLTIPPLITSTTALISGTVTSGASISLSFDRVGCDPVTYPTLDTWQCTASGLSEGDNSINLTVKNSMGFYDHVYGNVTVDTLSPSVLIISPGKWQTYTEKPTIDFTTSNGDVKVFVNGTRTFDWSNPLEELREGSNIVRVESTDTAGNTGFDESEFYTQGAAIGEKAYAVSTPAQSGSSVADTVDESARDAAGNVYVVGTTYGNLADQTNHGLADAFLRKYDPNGNILWTKLIGTTANEYGRGVVLDNAGNIYVLWDVFYTSVKGKSQDWSNVIVGKYSSTGSQIWTSQIGSKQKDYAAGLAFDNVNSFVYVGGNTEGSIKRNIYGGGKDYFIAALYASSGRLFWAKQSGIAGDETISALSAIDIWGVYASVNEQPAGGLMKPLFVAYSPVGDYKFKKNIYASGANVDAASTDMVVDSSNNFFVVGRVNVFDGRNNEFFLAKLNEADTTPLWVKVFGSDANDEATSVDLDAIGNLFIAGTSDGTLQDGYPVGGKDIFVAKVSTTGVRKWIKQLGTTADDIASSVLVQPAGTVVITGHTKGQLGAVPAGDFDVFLLKMTPVP